MVALRRLFRAKLRRIPIVYPAITAGEQGRSFRLGVDVVHALMLVAVARPNDGHFGRTGELLLL